MNIVLKRYLACQTFSIAVYPYVHTLIKLMLTVCTTASVEHCLSRWRCYKYTCKITLLFLNNTIAQRAL